jgi:hypothetical protein
MVAMGNGEKYMSKKNSAVLAGAFIVGIVILFGIFSLATA